MSKRSMPKQPTDPHSYAQPTGNQASYEADGGLTKREMFAAMAMQAYIQVDVEQDLIAEMAVDRADELIKQLNETIYPFSEEES